MDDLGFNRVIVAAERTNGRGRSGGRLFRFRAVLVAAILLCGALPGWNDTCLYRCGWRGWHGAYRIRRRSAYLGIRRARVTLLAGSGYDALDFWNLCDRFRPGAVDRRKGQPHVCTQVAASRSGVLGDLD